MEMGAGSRPFDYGTAELVAFASLLEAGTPVRLTGQDSQRGTFNQRHAVMVDIETEARYIPLEHISDDAGASSRFTTRCSRRRRCWASSTASRAIIRRRWCCGRRSSATLRTARRSSSTSSSRRARRSGDLLSGVVMLLPHGYEGQGPEHSSARIERYLQLAAHGQYADLPAFDGGAVLPSAAAAGDASVAQAADRVYAEEHAAASGCVVSAGGLREATASRMCCRTTR